VTVDDDDRVRIVFQCFDSCFQYRLRCFLNYSLVCFKQDRCRKRDLNYRRRRQRTTIVACRTCNLWALIFVIRYTIAISIRTSFVLSQTRLVRAEVILIGNTITIPVRTAFQAYRTSLVRTIVIFVRNSVTIAVRTTVELSDTRNGTT